MAGTKNDYPGQNKTRWGLRVFAGMVVALLCLATVHAWLTSRASVGLRAQVAVFARAGEPTKGEDLEQPTVADGQNAVLPLRRAAGTIVSTTQPFHDFGSVTFALPWTAKERACVDETIAASAAAFDDVALAMTKPGVDWQIKVRSPTISTLLPDLGTQRQLSRLLAASAIQAHLRGDDALALDRVHEILFLSRALEQMAPTVIRHLVAAGVHGHACTVIEAISPDLRVDQPAVREKAAHLIAELGADEAVLQRGIHSGVLAERVFIIDTAHCLAAGTLTMPLLSGMSGRSSMLSVVGSAPGGSYLTRPFIYSDATRCLERATETLPIVDAPNWPIAKVLIEAVNLRWAERERRGELHDFAKLIAASFDRAALTQFRTLADGRMAQLALALRLYANDHGGKRPSALSDLAPAYLAAVPLDPFSPVESPIQYISRAADPILYSVDENMTDDGGSEAKKPVGGNSANGRWTTLDAVWHLARQARDPATIDDAMRDEAESAR